MTARSVVHSSFVIERTFAATPVQVFHAYADPAAKARWFGGPADWKSGAITMDFRVGGREHAEGGPPGGPIHYFDAVYYDIVPDERIVSTYDMHMDDKRISVSLAVTELKPDGAGTKLVYTESIAFLDGYDNVESRRHGTEELLNALGKSLSH